MNDPAHDDEHAGIGALFFEPGSDGSEREFDRGLVDSASATVAPQVVFGEPDVPGSELRRCGPPRGRLHARRRFPFGA
jgi:hypothetical protein